MNRLLPLFFLFTIALFSNELVQKNFGSFQENKKSAESFQSVAKNLYLSYTKYPKHVYKNQSFEIIVEVLITRNDFTNIKTKFISKSGVMPLNPQEQWVKSDIKNKYFINYYFKANDLKFEMPALEVILYNNEEIVEARLIEPNEISFSQIAKSDERFTGVIAKNLEVLGSKTKQYSNKEALTVIELKGDYSNLEDFYLQGFDDQGITIIEDNFPSQHMIYNVNIPIHKKSLIFNYYNSEENIFKNINLPIVFDEELVSTQTNLNPNNSSFEFYKKIGVGVLTFVLLLIFIWKRNYIILLLSIVTFIIFSTLAMPNKLINLKKDTVIYILPTKNSTIFQKVTKQSMVEEMKRKNGFIKIMFGKENYIGWVKEEDVSKD